MRAPLKTAALIALACAPNAHLARIDEVRQGLLGLNERQVLSCLGPPAAFAYPDPGRAVWAYVRPLGSSPAAIPRVHSPQLADRKLREFLGDPLNQPVVAGYCRLTLELADGAVTAMQVSARGPSGLNADVQCAQQADICFEPESGH